MWDCFGFGSMMGWGWLWMLVEGPALLGLIVLVVWAVSRALPRQSPAAKPASDADEILRQRFARGEISAEEFRQAREELRRK
ncbi:MAG: SHOCT domain-containing protein [Chloroflexi bacterium]|nr:SHOCT domain-containing protein [Chloroflexota bacterium]